MPINTKRILGLARLIFVSFRTYKVQLIVLAVLGFLGGISEAVGISAAIPLFYLMTGKSLEEADNITHTVSQAFEIFHLPLNPLFLLLFIIGLFIAKAAIQFSTRYITARITSDFEEKTRTDLFSRTLKASWPYLLNRRAGYLEATLITDVERGSTIFTLISGAMIFITGFLTYTIAAFSISAPITFLTIGCGAMLFLFLKPVFHRSRRLFETATRLNKEVQHHLLENFLGTKVIKAGGHEEPVLAKARTHFEALRNIRVRTAFYRQSSLAVIEPAGFVLIAALFAFSYKSPTFSIASFAVIMYLIQKMFTFIQSFQNHIHAINEFAPSLKSIRQYRRTIREHQETDQGKEAFAFRECLEFRGVQFAYDPRRELLSDISFSISKGSLVGIIGPSGSGKTTIVDMILRLLNPRGGQILVDGKDIATIKLKEWRHHISYVAQDAFLLDDTIRNNIRFYNNSLSNEAIITASKKANIYDTIMELPDGFDTVMGDRGVKLSGGQRQRIALARALASQPDIIILDEATSAIDGASEALIQKSITDLRGNVTIVVIAHRLSTVMNLDTILVLKNGTIVEKGAPDELSKNPTSYLSQMQ